MTFVKSYQTASYLPDFWLAYLTGVGRYVGQSWSANMTAEEPSNQYCCHILAQTNQTQTDKLESLGFCWYVLWVCICIIWYFRTLLAFQTWLSCRHCQTGEISCAQGTGPGALRLMNQSVTQSAICLLQFGGFLSNCKAIVILNHYFWFYLSMIQPPYWQKTQRLVFEGLPESPMTLCSNCQPRNMKCWWSLNTRSEKYHLLRSAFWTKKSFFLLAAISHAVPGRLLHDRQWSLGWENKASTASGWNLVGFESIWKPQG